jgi:hypothetical protein
MSYVPDRVEAVLMPAPTVGPLAKARAHRQLDDAVEVYHATNHGRPPHAHRAAMIPARVAGLDQDPTATQCVLICLALLR